MLAISLTVEGQPHSIKIQIFSLFTDYAPFLPLKRVFNSKGI